MNIQEYVYFLGRIRYRNTVNDHKDNLEKIAKIIERVTEGTYARTMYVHRPTHIILLSEIKNDKQYLPILEKALNCKLNNLKESRQNELYELSKKRKRWPKPVKLPPEWMIKKIHDLLDVYEAQLVKDKVHPHYKFVCIKGKIAFKPSAVLFQTGEFPKGSYEQKKLDAYFGKKMPDTVFNIVKNKPSIVLNTYLIEGLGMKGKEAEITKNVDKILRDGLKKTTERVKELNRQLDEDIKNLR